MVDDVIIEETDIVWTKMPPDMPPFPNEYNPEEVSENG